MSLAATAYHVIVPSDLTYYVEADSEEDAVQKVAEAIAGKPGMHLPQNGAVCILADRTTHKPNGWDEEFASACAGCGCEIDTDIHPTM